MQTSLLSILSAARIAATQGWHADVVKSDEFRSDGGRAKCFFSRISKPNELIFNTVLYDSVCLKSPRGPSFRMRRN